MNGKERKKAARNLFSFITHPIFNSRLATNKVDTNHNGDALATPSPMRKLTRKSFTYCAVCKYRFQSNNETSKLIAKYGINRERSFRKKKDFKEYLLSSKSHPLKKKKAGTYNKSVGASNHPKALGIEPR